MTGHAHSPPEYRRSGRPGELSSHIEIHTAPGRIWEILTDFRNYPVWNPFIRSISGNPVEGEKVTVHLQPSGAFGMTIHPDLLKVNLPRELRWVGHLFIQGIFDGEHIFEIIPLDDHRCRFIQREYFSGSSSPS